MAHSAPEKDVGPGYSVESTRDSASAKVTRHRTNPWWRFGGKDQCFVPVNVPSTAKSTWSPSDEDELVNENTIYGSVFSDSRAQEFYKPIEKYEGRHRFDMHATWSEEEEKNLVRRVSARILPSTTSTRFRMTYLDSSTGGSVCGPVSCFLHYSLIEATSIKRSQTICLVCITFRKPVVIANLTVKMT